MSAASSKEFDLKTGVMDMTGKVVIVTGGNAGIGFSTVRHLLRYTNAKVYLAARNETRAAAAIAQLHSEGLGRGSEGGEHKGLGEVVWLKLDLSDPREVRRVAEEFVRTEERLDVLINNAGGAFSGISKDGVSNMHIVNYIGLYVFMRALLPLLLKTSLEPDSDVRIINVASMAHGLPPATVKFDDIDDFNVQYSYRPFSFVYRYGNAKLALMLWSRHLQHRLRQSAPPTGNGITVISLHPGFVDTSSHALRPLSLRALTAFLMHHLAGMIDVDTGALTSMFAAAGKRVREEREVFSAGVYLVPFGAVKVPAPGTPAADEELGEKLVETTERFLKGIGLE